MFNNSGRLQTPWSTPPSTTTKLQSWMLTFLRPRWPRSCTTGTPNWLLGRSRLGWALFPGNYRQLQQKQTRFVQQQHGGCCRQHVRLDQDQNYGDIEAIQEAIIHQIIGSKCGGVDECSAAHVGLVPCALEVYSIISAILQKQPLDVVFSSSKTYVVALQRAFNSYVSVSQGGFARCLRDNESYA